MTITSAPVPYGIMTSICKEYADQLIHPIKKIWQASSSLESRKLPESTSQAITTPIYKYRMKNNPPNYRPIALINHFTKIFERIH